MSDIFRLGKLITMAGLDASDSPFNNTSNSMPKFNRSFAKSNGYSGDISSDGQINGSFNNLSRKPMNGNIRPKPYLTSNKEDPTMKNSYLDDSHDEAQRRRDELYERILQETSNAFRNIGEQDLTINITGDTTRMHDDSMDSRQLPDESRDSLNVTPMAKSPEKTQKSRIPRPGAKKGGTGSDNEAEKSVRSEHLESIKGPGGEIIMSLSPFDDEPEGDSRLDSPDRHGEQDDSRVASPSKGGRASDFSYGMESFEQSYVSERGELVHLGDEDFYAESQSPIQQSDNEEF